MDKETAVTLTGTVEDVVFYNEDNGYTQEKKVDETVADTKNGAYPV